MNYFELEERYDAALAMLIRHNLKAHGLDVEGTVYYDEGLDHLSLFYGQNPEKRAYYVLTDDAGNLIGGIGFAEFLPIPDCAELQKLYLADEAKGKGLGRQLVRLVEEKAKAHGYKKMYLETHTNLAVAISLYAKEGYVQIPRPDAVVHGTMNRFYLKDL